MKSPIAVLAATAAAAALTVSLAAAAARPGIHWGPAQAVGAGTARAWVAVDMDGSPGSMGVTLDPAALESARRGRGADIVLPLPVSSGVRAAGTHRGPEPAFRLLYDERSRNVVIVLEGLATMPQPIASR